MKVALVTTTINVPTVLRLYRAYGPDVAFFVAGDLKTPDECLEIDGVYMTPTYQKALGYKCSPLLGWNCIARRNIATLEALRWGADIIVMVDDDNIPMNEFYFFDHIKALTGPRSGLMASGIDGWFDSSKLLVPATSHRGFPHGIDGGAWLSGVVDVKIGVNAGICLGDPDIGAATRIANPVGVHNISQILQVGIMVDHETKTVFNSQNTSFIRELAPAMFMMPGVGRFDDIYASLICQRVMRDRGLHVNFGRPFVWQERNQHNLINDLRDEIDGMENIERFAQKLDTLPLANLSVIEAVRMIYVSDDILPIKAVQAAHVFLDDCEKVMG